MALAPTGEDSHDRRPAKSFVKLRPAGDQLRGQRETALGGKLEGVLRHTLLTRGRMQSQDVDHRLASR